MAIEWSLIDEVEVTDVWKILSTPVTSDVLRITTTITDTSGWESQRIQSGAYIRFIYPESSKSKRIYIPVLEDITVYELPVPQGFRENGYLLRSVSCRLSSRLFDGVYGSELDGSRSIKGDLIHHILLIEKLLPSTVVMVGDRSHDIIGAKRHHIASIGVTYGYGTEEELKAHGADLIAHSPSDISRLIISNSK